MKNVLEYQIVVMLQDSLPGNYAYNSIKEQINANISCFKTGEKKVYDISSEDNATLPPEVARLVYENKSNTLQVSASSIVYKCKDVSDKEDISSIIGYDISEIDNVMNYISDPYQLKYRLGIIVTINIKKEAMQQSLADAIKEDIKDCPEVELSLLKKRTSSDIEVNYWNRRFFNSGSNQYRRVIDVNTSIDSEMRLGTNKLVDVYNGSLLEILKEAYDELR